MKKIKMIAWLLILSFNSFSNQTIPLPTAAQLQWQNSKLKTDQAKTYELYSPNTNLSFTFSLIDGIPYYSLSVDGKIPIKNAKLGLVLNKPFIGKYEVINTSKEKVEESYEMQWWKSRKVLNHYNEMIVSLEELSENPKKLDIIFRAYSDGIAIRYSFPEQENLNDFVIEEDLTEFAFTDDYTWWSANGEKDNLGPLSINIASNPVFTPMVVKCSNDLYLGIHEAAIYDFANFKIKKANKPNAFQCDLQGSSRAKTGMQTSWRVIFVGKTPGELVESNLLINLNPPCKIEDTSWIKTGLSMWDWRVWGYTAPDGFVYGLNTPSHKRLIDFASENNIDFLLMDADWYGPELSEDSDPTESNNLINIESYITVAKRAGEKWFVGSLTTRESRALTINLDFLTAGVKYNARIFEDSRETHFINNRESYQLRQFEVTKDTELKVWLAPGGGNAILIEPVEMKPD